jgi:hypothetical protein
MKLWKKSGAWPTGHKLYAENHPFRAGTGLPRPDSGPEKTIAPKSRSGGP